MKLIAILLTVAFLQVRADGYTQATITFSGKDVALEKVVTAIKQQTGYTFFYTMDIWKDAKPVTINVKNATIVQVLNLIMEQQPFSYIIEDKTIIISKKKEQQREEQKRNEAPPIDVRGRVVNESGEPVQATVAVKGTSKGTSTNQNGEFHLVDVDENAVLVISGVGIEEREFKVAGKSNLSVVVKIGIKALDEVQMIAYGTTTRRLNTGNVSTVKASDIEKQPVNNPLLALEGRVAGLSITQATGVAGSAVTVRIQGQNSLQKGNEPLYVIDGVPYLSQLISTQPDFLGSILGSAKGTTSNGNPLSYINPADIESIEILKDADATSIYGSRAANGAILITTKKGKIGKLRANVNVQNGWGKVTRTMDLLNLQQYLEMRKEAFQNDNATVGPFDYDLNGTWDSTRDANWQKELIGHTANYLDVQPSITGGNNSVQYLVGAGYHRETTVFPGKFSDQKGSLHFSVNTSSLNEKFKMSLTGNYLFDKNKLPGGDLTPYALRLQPNAPPLTNDDGSLNWAPNATGATTWQNGIHPLGYTVSGYETKANNLVTNSTLSYKILPTLNIKGNLGYTNLQTNELNTIPLTSYAPESRANATRIAIYSNNTVNSWIIEPQINYEQRIGKGKIEALAGSTIHELNSNGQVLFATGFVSDALLKDIKSASSVTTDASTVSTYKYNALFGRVTFNWNSRYIVNGTYRRDGSSRFGAENQFHNFGSVGAAWIFSNEELIHNRLKFLSFGKIRGSYGTTGNDQIGDYQYLSLMSALSVGVPYQNTVGLTVNSLNNPYLQWEETKKLQVGIDLGFLNDRILVSGNYYDNRSSNQLLNYSLPIISGFNSIVKNFPATVRNYGWEFTLNTVNFKSRDFNWSTNLNLTIPENKLLKFPDLTRSSLSSTLVVGEPITIIKVYHLLGVNPQTGIYQFDDGYGNPTTRPDTASKVTQNTLVNTAPQFYGGFQNNFKFKNIELDFLFQFVKQMGPEYLFSGLPGRFSGGNQPVGILDRWQKTGDNSSFQKYTQTIGAVSTGYNAALLSDFTYGDASFIRLKNVSLGWNFPDAWTKRMHIQNFKVYVQGQNLVTITKYKGLDPETRSSTTLPPLRMLTVGIIAAL